MFGPEVGLGSQWLSELELSLLNKGPIMTWDLASPGTSVLAVVRHHNQQGGLVDFSVCLQACYWLYFPEGETKVSKVYWFAYSDSVSRQGIRSKTNFLASFPMHTTLYLTMPRLEAKNPSQRIWSENIWRVILKPQKHWESHKDV